MSRIIISRDKQWTWLDGRLTNLQNVVDIDRFKNKLVVTTAADKLDISIVCETEQEAEGYLLAIKAVLIDLDGSVSGIR